MTKDLFVKFPDIEGFHNIMKHVKKYPDHIPSKIYYSAKVKLHGTNAGVLVTKDGQVYAQSRTRIIDINTDNAGFAFYVDANREYFASLADGRFDLVIYGEWYGPGVQKGVAASQVDKKHFAVFAIQSSPGPYKDEEPGLIVDSEVITLILTKQLTKTFDELPLEIIPEIDFGDDADPLSIAPNRLSVNFFDIDSVNRFVEIINKLTYAVEESDPYIKGMHGVDGIGEGIVCYPYMMQSRGTMCELTFKSKGEKHGNVVKTGKPPTTVDPVKVESTNKYVDMFVTEARLVQIAERDLHNVFEISKTGDFLKAFGTDCYKESVANLVESGLEWKDVQGAVSKAARDWFITKCKMV